MNKTIPILVALSLLCITSIVFGETIPPESWVYDALRSFELRSLVALEPTLPYTFDQCEAYVGEITAAIEKDNVTLGPRHRFLLRRLTAQFIGTREKPQQRYNRPLSVYRDGDRWAAIDLSVAATFQRRVDEKKGEADGLAVPSVLVDLGHRLTMETSYRLVMTPERGSRARNAKPDARTRSYRGLTGEFTRGLVSINGRWWRSRAGREYLQWGSGRREGLILSQTASSLDHFGGSIDLKRFTLSTVQASLQSDWGRRLAGHRLTVALPGGAFAGVSETVVYVNDSFDWKYFTPLGAFYAQQFNEDSNNNDNILWSIDWKVPLRRGLIVSGEFLVDDIQYERDDKAGADRLGLSIFADALFLIGARELEITGGYTYIDIYTYGHRFGTEYVTGDGGASMNSIIGSPLGPDADRWLLRASLGVSERAEIGVEGSYTRRGEENQIYNNNLQDWYPGLDNDPRFPSGDVLSDRSASATFRYDLTKGSYISALAGVRWREGGPQGLDAEDGFGRLELYLDL